MNFKMVVKSIFMINIKMNSLKLSVLITFLGKSDLLLLDVTKNY